MARKQSPSKKKPGRKKQGRARAERSATTALVRLHTIVGSLQANAEKWLTCGRIILCADHTPGRNSHQKCQYQY